MIIIICFFLQNQLIYTNFYVCTLSATRPCLTFDLVPIFQIPFFFFDFLIFRLNFIKRIINIYDKSMSCNFVSALLGLGSFFIGTFLTGFKILLPYLSLSSSFLTVFLIKLTLRIINKIFQVSIFINFVICFILYYTFLSSIFFFMNVLHHMMF